MWGDPKSSKDVVLDKLLDIHIPDIGQGLGFDPFSEIVRADQYIPLISYRIRKKAYNV